MRGEEEVKNRLENGLLENFTLASDRRKDGCGYDVLCNRNGEQVQVEVKTFTAEGRVIVTRRELAEAASSQSTHFLFGILDDGGLPQAWETFLLPDPFETLLRSGKFDIQISLKASASEVFNLDDTE